FRPVRNAFPGLVEQLLLVLGRCRDTEAFAEYRTCQSVAKDRVATDARRLRRLLAAFGRRELEPDFLSLVEVFTCLLGLPALRLSTGSNDRPREQNSDQGDEANESAQHPSHGGSPEWVRFLGSDPHPYLWRSIG